MVFPLLLSGSPVVICKDWCRNCDQGDYQMVPTVKSPGAKGKRYCSECWTSWLPLLTSVERGEIVLESTSCNDDVYEVCKNQKCASRWKKARHVSGHCSYSCAVAAGWQEPMSCEYRICKNHGCGSKSKKARHVSDHCSYTCAVNCGWKEGSNGAMVPTPVERSLTVTTSQTESLTSLSTRTMVPPPVDLQLQMSIGETKDEGKQPHDITQLSILDEIKATNKIISKIANGKMLKNYIESGKGCKVIQHKSQLGRQGLGYKDRKTLWGNSKRTTHFVPGEIIEPQQKKAFVMQVGHQASEVGTSQEKWEINDALLAIALAEQLGSLNMMNS